MTDVADKIEANGDKQGADYLRNHIDEDIMQCMVDVLKVLKSFNYLFNHLLYFFNLLFYDCN